MEADSSSESDNRTPLIAQLLHALDKDSKLEKY